MILLKQFNNKKETNHIDLRRKVPYLKEEIK